MRKRQNMNSRGARFLWAWTIVAVCACGDDEAPVAPVDEMETGQLAVAGVYTVAQSWAEEGCGLSGALDTLPGQVDHTMGATRFQLVAGEAGFAGSVSNSGQFDTDPITFTESDGAVTTITVAGTFDETGFDAELSVMTDRSSAPGESCMYRIAWDAALNAGRNVIPGG